jgi:nicotinamide mononucleotide transporter PnuC
MNWKISKKIEPLVLLLILTMVLVTISSVLVRQSIIRVFPLYVSMAISLLLSKVNRYAYLLGGINAISYGFIALYYRIPGSAISAFLVSSPLQLISFVRWSKTKWKNTTVLKEMTPKARMLNGLLLVVGWILYYLLIRILGSASSLIDSVASLLGIYITILQLLKYSEYTVLMIPSGLLSSALYISLMVQGSMEQLPFLIYSFFSLACTIRSVRQAKIILKAQKEAI